MSRLRARLSKSEVDRELQEHLAAAQRALEKAARVCDATRRMPGVAGKRAPRIARELARIKGALGNVSRLTPLYDLEDPDLMSEEDRSELWRERREAKRAAAAALESSESSESEDGE